MNTSIMKKQYIKPEVNVEEILTVTMLAASGMGVGDDVYDEDTDVASTTRRGTWGNLWE